MIQPLFFGAFGGIELAVIVGIAILLFGANKIPELARSTGRSIGEFKKGREEVEKELQSITGKDQETVEQTETTDNILD